MIAAAYRAEILALPEPERVEHALALLDHYLAPVPAYFARMADLGLRLTPHEARLLYALARRRGAWISLQSALAAAMGDRDPDTWPSDRVIYGKIMGLRAKLARARLGAEIITWPGVGYRLAAPEGLDLIGEGRA